MPPLGKPPSGAAKGSLQARALFGVWSLSEAISSFDPSRCSLCFFPTRGSLHCSLFERGLSVGQSTLFRWLRSTLMGHAMEQQDHELSSAKPHQTAFMVFMKNMFVWFAGTRKPSCSWVFSCAFFGKEASFVGLSEATEVRLGSWHS